ncbi:MAG TPA: fibronectin type III domain-containing protein [Thermoanaerobaculia bacterium]|nr:fibronectin type III domain-containing protein [Thermoanaerobaculia bacterium]
MSIRSISVRGLLLALLALVAAPLAATSYVPVSDEALVDGSPVAAVVRVVSKDRAAGLRNPGLGAVTEYVIQVEEALKGQIPGGLGIVRVPGGLGRNGATLKISGAPRFVPGERALLFLEAAGDGSWRVQHLLLGAFYEVEAGGRRLAVRDLSEARELRRTAAGIEEAPGRDLPRDFDAFARWIADRARSPRVADYYVDGGLGQSTAPFRLFKDIDDDRSLRWFDFDISGNIKWRAYNTGQQGLTGGGYAEFQSALAAWNNEPQTPVDYRYDGKTPSQAGLETNDGINSVVFNDPTNIITNVFNCAAGGVLALGGPWYEIRLTNHNGTPFHKIVEADIVINNGIGCFFAGSPSPAKAAEELFAHELGHTLGLNHACGDPDDGPDPDPDPNCLNPVSDDALMRAFIHDDGRGGRLNSDDRAGLRALYGPAAPTAPTALSATALSTTTIHLTWTDNASNESGYRIEMRTLTGTFEEVVVAPANSTSAEISGLEPATGYVFRVQAVRDNEESAYSNEATATTNGPVGACVANANTVCLNGGRFRVQVEWKTSAGNEGFGTSVPVSSDDSALLWFFEDDNWEMLVKVLDGCNITNRYWVFFAATTDVQFVLTVTDTQTGKAKTYLNPLGLSADAVTDTGALDVCP